jgi:ribosomal protein S15P/S13E
MGIVEHLENLTRDPTQYFALGNKMKQISKMRDYIKLWIIQEY